MAVMNNFLALVLQLSVPLVLGALCGTIAERGGIILLGVEGMMLLGAFAGTAGSFFTGSAFAGVLFSVLIGGLIGWIYALFCLKWKAHQSVVGVGVNLFASGITAVLLKAIWHTEGMSEPVKAVSNLTVPVLSEIPVLGAFFKISPPTCMPCCLSLRRSGCCFTRRNTVCATAPSVTSLTPFRLRAYR